MANSGKGPAPLPTLMRKGDQEEGKPYYQRKNCNGWAGKEKEGLNRRTLQVIKRVALKNQIFAFMKKVALSVFERRKSEAPQGRQVVNKHGHRRKKGPIGHHNNHKKKRTSE